MWHLFCCVVFVHSEPEHAVCSKKVSEWIVSSSKNRCEHLVRFVDMNLNTLVEACRIVIHVSSGFSSPRLNFYPTNLTAICQPDPQVMHGLLFFYWNMVWYSSPPYHPAYHCRLQICQILIYDLLLLLSTLSCKIRNQTKLHAVQISSLSLLVCVMCN